MTNQFEILARFLDRFGDDVEGREFAELPPGLDLRLRALARGELPAADQEEVLDLLNRNPQWIGQLAEEVKALRVN